MNKMDEIIIVARRSKVFENEHFCFQGTEQNQTFVERIVENISNSFELMRRGDAETNFDYLQPIPYAVIKRGKEIFLYERLKGAGESRLHNKLSLGVGGHMNEIEDAVNFEEVLTENLFREVTEELNVGDQEIQLQPIGLINDDENEVGRVHIGILVIIHVPEGQEVTVRETDQLDGKFVSLEELKQKETYDRLENWSKIAVNIL